MASKARTLNCHPGASFIERIPHSKRIIGRPRRVRVKAALIDRARDGGRGKSQAPIKYANR